MSRGFWTVAAFAASLAFATEAADAQAPVAPYDGSIPFRCELQDVGTGTDFPDPDADPFCVEYDKTQQNVTDLGFVEFLLQEPTRLLALLDEPAGTKCFYFQRDHWTGSLIQGQPPEIWNWEGNYWIDRARGVGGGSLRNLRFLGAPVDMTPLVPPEYQAYVDPGGGFGAQFTLETEPDPACAARVDTPGERDDVYPDADVAARCVPPGGELRGRRVGAVKLDMKRSAVRERLGPPRRAKRRADRWCLIGAAKLSVAYRKGAAVLIKTSSRGHALRGVARGDRARRALRRLGPIAFRAGKARVIAAGGNSKRAAFAGIRGKRVRWLALAHPGLAPSATRAALRRSR